MPGLLFIHVNMGGTNRRAGEKILGHHTIPSKIDHSPPPTNGLVREIKGIFQKKREEKGGKLVVRKSCNVGDELGSAGVQVLLLLNF